MSGHRVELRVTFTVGDGADGGRAAAHGVLQRLETLRDYGLEDFTGDFEVTPSTVDGIGWYEKWPPVTKPEDPFDRLVRLTETHLRMLKSGDFSAPLVDRLRRDDCMHDWSAPESLRGYEDAIDCLKCGLRVVDGYRPYYPKRTP